MTPSFTINYGLMEAAMRKLGSPSRHTTNKSQSRLSTDVPLLIGRKRAHSVVIGPGLVAVLDRPTGVKASDIVLTRLRRLPGRIVSEDAETGVLLIEIPGLGVMPRTGLQRLSAAEVMAMLTDDASEWLQLRSALSLARAHQAKVGKMETTL